MSVERGTAEACVVIAAPREQVWAALLRPETLMRIAPVDEVVVPWGGPGTAFRWRMHLQQRAVEVHGTVLRVEPGRVLEYEYVDPHTLLTRGLEEHHRVRFELADADGATTVAVTQDNHASEAALEHARGGWRLALHNLKAIVEGARVR